MVQTCHEKGLRICYEDGRGAQKKGKPKRRWMESINMDLREKGLSEEMQNWDV